MGDAVGGRFLEGENVHLRTPASLDADDLSDLFYTLPHDLDRLGERARLAGSAELDIFLTGMMVARSFGAQDPKPNTETRRSRDIVASPADLYDRKECRRVAARMLGRLANSGSPVPVES